MRHIVDRGGEITALVINQNSLLQLAGLSACIAVVAQYGEERQHISGHAQQKIHMLTCVLGTAPYAM